MAITAGLVRELRERSGAGMMDCKKALEATSGDIEAAFDHLRKQGLKSADKKAGREMSEGRVQAMIGPEGRSGSLVAITCETDFVAKTPDFEALMTGLCEHVLNHKPRNAEELAGQAYASTGTDVTETLKMTVGKLGENIQLGDVRFLETSSGYVGSYVHHNSKVGAIVAIETDADAAKAQGVAKDVCMHIAFHKPAGMGREDIPADEVEREKAIFLEEVKGKPEEIQEKIVEGKLNKYFAGRVLPEQAWYKDDKTTVAKTVQAELGKEARILGFGCFAIGG